MSKNSNISNFKLAVGTTLLVPLLFAGSVLAQNRQEVLETAPPPPDRPVSNSQEQEATIMESTATEESTNASDSRTARINERKERVKVSLGEQEAAKLKRLCKPTQAKLERYRQRVVGISVSQEQTRDNLLERLNRLSDQLRLANVETAELNQKISGLQNKYDSLSGALEVFGAAVDDAAEMDCAADPEGYKAALVEARELRVKVVSNAKSVREFINTELKPALTQARQSLAGTVEEN